jgi:hypothetical protein
VIATDEEGDPLYEDIGPTLVFSPSRAVIWQPSAALEKANATSPPLLRALFHRARRYLPGSAKFHLFALTNQSEKLR